MTRTRQRVALNLFNMD